MRKLLATWWTSFRTARWSAGERRHQVSDERARDHLSRQEAGIRDRPWGGG